MKAKILFILCIAFAISSISAQNMRFGAKVGGNLATFTEFDEKIDPKFGMNFGAVATIEISDAFSIQPELFYSAQGYKRDFEEYEVRAKIDYFNIPILADLTVIEGLSLQAGPQFGVNIRKERDSDGQDSNTRLNVNAIEAAAVFGLQYKFDDNFFIQGRYAMGLSEVFLNDEAKSSVLSFSIGFFFDRIEDDYDN